MKAKEKTAPARVMRRNLERVGKTDGGCLLAALVRLPKKREHRDQRAGAGIDQRLGDSHRAVIGMSEYRVDSSQEKRVAREANKRWSERRFSRVRVNVLLEHVASNLSI